MLLLVEVDNVFCSRKLASSVVLRFKVELVLTLSVLVAVLSVVDAEVTAVSDVTTADMLSEVKFGSSVSVLSWNVRVDVNIGSVCDNCGMLVGVL